GLGLAFGRRDPPPCCFRGDSEASGSLSARGGTHGLEPAPLTGVRSTLPGKWEAGELCSGPECGSWGAVAEADGGRADPSRPPERRVLDARQSDSRRVDLAGGAPGRFLHGPRPTR